MHRPVLLKLKIWGFACSNGICSSIFMFIEDCMK